MRPRRTWLPVVGGALLGLFSISPMTSSAEGQTVANSSTATPIKHLVVIFQENVSFDHYFATYPEAANTSGQPFKDLGHVRVNNLANTPGAGGVGTLLTNNPNKDMNGNQVNPRRYSPTDVNDLLTCDQNHNYDSEQKSFNGGAMDKFVTTVGTGSGTSPTGQTCNAADVMNYYDGNTVTALWNYAQQFAMSDNSFDTTFGPSSPGAINLVTGNTGTVGLQIKGPNNTVPDGKGGFSLIGDDQPYYDDCSTRDAVSMTGNNIGDLLNAKGLSWGWFQGGFKPTTTYAVAAPGQPTSTFIPDQFSGKFATKPASNQGICNAVHPVGIAVGGVGQYGYKDDYIPHHEPFMYYASTANPHHLSPTSLAAIGTDTQTFIGGTPQFDTANHQYDSSDFDALVAAISRGLISPDHLPAVSFLKAPGYQDGHAAYSDPLDEQQFIVNEINALQHTPDWSSTAVVIAYDDSDGWYDHAFSGVHNASTTSSDFLTASGQCGAANAPRLGGQQGRCGYGPRQPLLVISPFARENKVDHTLTDLSSILKFAEDNWKLGTIDGSFDSIAGSLNGMFDFSNEKSGDNSRKFFLDPITGQPLRSNS
jgi:phospholipase C